MEPNKTTLGLELPTDPRWVNIAEKNLEEILIDHAFCEQKAASTCISLIVSFPDHEKLVETLTPIVAEEWAHFELVLSHMNKRGYKLGQKRKDEYVTELHSVLKKGGSRKDQLTERLLISALIEARSCERFKLLYKNLKDEELKRFYYDLMVSEAGHYHAFIELAKEYQDEEKIERRWKEFLKAEAEIMKQLEPRSDRMH